MKREHIAEIMLKTWYDQEKMDCLEDKDKVIAEEIKNNIGMIDDEFDFLNMIFLVARKLKKDSEIMSLIDVLDFLQVHENTLMCHYIMQFYHQECIEDMSMDMLFHIFE